MNLNNNNNVCKQWCILLGNTKGQSTMYLNYNKICNILIFLIESSKDILRVFWKKWKNKLINKEKRSSARADRRVLFGYLGMTRTVLLHCPIKCGNQGQ